MKFEYTYIIHTDGGARGNPGPAAIGVVIERVGEEGGDKKPCVSFGKVIGSTTNNVAEYQALIEALLWMQKSRASGEIGEGSIQCYLDSTLVVHQLNGVYRIKETHLQTLAGRVQQLRKDIGEFISFHAVPREQNKEADALVNEALDAHVVHSV